MEKNLREMPNQQQLQTSNICLGAALLALVPRSFLACISPSPSVDGKRMLTITYSAEQESIVRQTIEAFTHRRLVIGLYGYNKALNALRDQLRQQTNGERRPDGCKYPAAVP